MPDPDSLQSAPCTKIESISSISMYYVQLLAPSEPVVEMQLVSTAVGSRDILKTNPVRIHLKEGAVPYAVHTARRDPLPLLPKVQKELERMGEHNVIEKVTQPTDCCAPMMPVMKQAQ